MTFDSHVLNLVDVAARLVNHLTPGEAGGVAVESPVGRGTPEGDGGRPRWRGPSHPSGGRRAGRRPARVRRAAARGVRARRARRRAWRRTPAQRAAARDRRPSAARPAARGRLARALPRLRRLARDRLVRRLRDRAGARDRQRPGRAAGHLRRGAVRPGVRGHLAQRDPAVLLDGLPEPHEGGGVPGPGGGSRVVEEDGAKRSPSRDHSRRGCRVVSRRLALGARLLDHPERRPPRVRVWPATR